MSGPGVEFGVFDWLDLPGDRPLADVYADRIALARAAEQAGGGAAFSRYHVAEHHGTPLGAAPSPGLYLAAVARETERIRLVPTTFIVPLYDPLRLAEEIAMLDQLSGGRLEVGIGKGSSPHEAAMFGHSPDDMAQRYAAYVPAILAALRTGTFTPPGGGEPIPLHVTAIQRPHPPIWYPTSNPESIARTAAEGMHTVFGFAFVSPPLEVIREHSRVYFDALAAASDRSADAAAQGAPRFGILRHVYVADTDAEAMATARRAFERHYETFGYLWRRHGSDRFDDVPDLDELVATYRMFVGSPATVAEQVATAVREGEVNYVAGAFAWGSMSRAETLASLGLFAEHVVPAVRRAGAEQG